LSTDDDPDLGPEIVGRYVDAYDLGANVSLTTSSRVGVVVRLEPTAIRAWDYADAAYV
jgi:hypothetical protein